MSNNLFQKALLAATQKYAGAVAIEEGEKKCTYAALEEAALNVAALLTDISGSSRGEAVGILTESVTGLVTAIAGTALAGKIFVPVDGNLPPRRITGMLEMACVSRILYDTESAASPELMRHLKESGFSFIPVNAEPEGGHNLPDYREDDSLYIYFTSGSTGTPKAVLGKNESLVQFVNWEISQFSIPAGSRFSQLITPGFDAFLRDAFVPLFSGGTIVVPADRQGWYSDNNLAKWIEEAHINYMHCVPGVFALLQKNLKEDSFPYLKAVFMSGERIHPGSLKPWYDMVGSRVQLYNFYGTTETTMIRCFYAIQAGDTALRRIPAGKPIAGTKLYVLDDAGLPCMPLQEGNVYISSPYVTKGYLAGGAIDSSVFSTDTMAEQPGYLLYSTGDTGRFLETGDLEILGRKDGQLKINGIRVEPGEVESLLVQCSGVTNAGVFKTEANGLEMLAAAVVMEDAEKQESAALLTAALQDQLPGYMIPGKWIFVKQLPKLANGKMDRAALAQLTSAKTTAGTDPLNETEQQLFDIWAAVIGNKNFDKTQSFFELGGNSFHLINLVAKVFQRFAIRLSIKDIFQHNTVEKLAACISSKTRAAKSMIPRAADAAYYNLSGGQFQVFHQQQLYEDAVVYNLPQFFLLQGAVEPVQLEAIFSKLVKAHPSLRTGFTIKDGKPMQFITDITAPVFEYADRTGITAEEEKQAMHEFVRPFDLEKPPLFRAKLIKKGGGNYILMTDVHHIAADGFSQLLMNRDLELLATGRELPAQQLRYVDYAEWQHAERSSDRFRQQQVYWQQKFTPLPPKVQLPVNRLSVDENNTEGSVYSFAFDNKITAAIKEAAAKNHTTLFVYLMAVYNVLLSKLSMQDDIVVGTPVEGRGREELADVTGMFVNTLAIRSRVDNGLSFRQFLETVKRNTAEALDNQDLPFDEVVNMLKLPASARNRLFNVMFVFLNMQVKKQVSADFSIQPYPYQFRTSKFDLTLTGFEADGEIRLKFEYSTQVFFEEQVKKVAEYMNEIVQQVLITPDMPVGEIALQHNLEATNYEVKDFEFNF